MAEICRYVKTQDSILRSIKRDKENSKISEMYIYKEKKMYRENLRELKMDHKMYKHVIIHHYGIGQ